MATRMGIEKAALLLYSLPPESAEKVITAMGPSRSEELRNELARLRKQGGPPGDVGELVRELEELLQQIDAAPTPTPPQLAAYRPPSDADVSLPPLPSDPLQALHALPPHLLAELLQGEQANTIALVLEDLPDETAGAVLRQLKPEMRREVTVRLSRLNGGSPELLARIARALVQKSQALSSKRGDAGAQAKYEKMANMLRCLEKTERQEVLTALEENEPATAARIRELLYSFEDLLRVQDRSLQKLLAEIDSKTLSVALKGANEVIREKMLANLSKRAREAIQEEMEFVGMVPLLQIRQAQKVIVDAMQRLDQAGALMMNE